MNFSLTNTFSPSYLNEVLLLVMRKILAYGVTGSTTAVTEESRPESQSQTALATVRIRINASSVRAQDFKESTNIDTPCQGLFGKHERPLSEQDACRGHLGAQRSVPFQQ